MYRDPYEVRATLRKDAYIMSDYPPILKGMKGAIIGALNKQLTTDEIRHIVLAWLFDYNGSGELPTEPFLPMSTRSLTEGHWIALNKWVSAYKDEVSGEWKCSDEFNSEVLSVARIAVPLFYKANNQAFDDLLDLPPFEAELRMMGGVITQESEDSV